MNSCTNLYFLSTIACQLSKCLDQDDLAILSADLVVLSDMLANILARQAACQDLEICSKETCQQESNPSQQTTDD